MSNNWKEAVISPEATIREAIQAIDMEGMKIALVVEEDGRLAGIVTDGDVRRGLLRQVSLEDKVTQVMNASPMVCAPDTPTEHIKHVLEEKVLLHMPIVADGKLVDLVTWEQLHERKRYDNPVVLMAGGFGTRLRPLTENTPKPLLKVGEKPVLERILERFVDLGFSNFYMSLHYLPELIRDHFGDGRKWGVNIQYIQEDTPLGTGGALSLIPKEDLSDLPLIMMNGDLLTLVDFEQLLLFHTEHQAKATMCVREYGFQVPYGVVEADEHRVTEIVEKPQHNFFVNAGIYVLDPSIVRALEPKVSIDTPEILTSLIAQGESTVMFPIHEYWLDIGQREDFEQAQLDCDRDFS